MRGSLLVLLCFFGGIFCGTQEVFPSWVDIDFFSAWTLYALLFIAGMTMGFNIRSWTVLADLKARVLLVPLGVVVGSLFGGAVAWLCLEGISLRDSLAVSSGFGYYSLSSVLITQLADPGLGSVALLANMVRELFTLLCAPLCQRIAGNLGPLSSGGAASMDTCLIVVAQQSGEKAAILAVFSGMCLTMLVPFLISALYS